jgi:hypothetical protein
MKRQNIEVKTKGKLDSAFFFVAIENENVKIAFECGGATIS